MSLGKGQPKQAAFDGRHRKEEEGCRHQGRGQGSFYPTRAVANE